MRLTGLRLDQLVFQNLMALEHIELQIPLRRVDQCSLRSQPDEFALGDGAAVTRGFASNRFYNPGDGRLVEVCEIHRDLRLPFDEEAGRFHETQAAAGMPHRFGDFLRHFHIARVKIDVEGDEERSGADDSRTGWA